jgi:hypothetical protein
VAEEVGTSPALPSIPTQLVDLGVPFAFDEQGRFLAGGISAVTLTTAGSAIVAPAPETRRLGQLGRAIEAIVSSLDASVGGAFRTPDSIFFANRAASGWTARLTLVSSVVPFALGVVDLIVRARRRRLPFAPALRAQRARLGVWAFGALLVWLGALAGVFPTGAPLPLPPYASFVESRPVFGVLVLALAFGLGWLAARRHLGASAGTTPEERLAGFAVALAVLGVVAVGLAALQPYALVFVLPSLYAWIWLPLEGRLGWRVALFGVGLAGPVLGLVLLGRQLGLSVVDAALYVIDLVTVGYLPLLPALLGLMWAAAAAQMGALAFGRYAPYAGGAEPPPSGPIRRALARALRLVPHRSTGIASPERDAVARR